MLVNPIKAVLFDLDDTLFDLRHSVRSGLAAIQQDHACLHHQSLDELEWRYRQLLDGLHPLMLQGVLTPEEARRERFRRLFAAYSEQISDETAQAAAVTYQGAHLAARQPVAGAIPLLIALRPRVKIGVVTNNLATEQRAKLRCCDLERFVDEAVISEEVGVTKPDPRIFAIALQRLGYQAQEAVMIGDTWAWDIVGAYNAGIRAIWLNRFGLPCPDPTLAAEIRSLQPLAEVLLLLLG